MNMIRFLIVGIAMSVLALTGCKKSEGVDTKPLEKSFATADASSKSESDKAVAAIKAGNYSEAMADLAKLGQQAKLTPDQQQAVKDTVEQVKKQISATADKAATDVKKGIDDVQKSLQK